MTTGELFGEAAVRLFDFLEAHPQRPSISAVDVARFIARWISRVYATKAIRLMGAKSPSALLEDLHYRYQLTLPKELRADFDKGSNSKLFYRMLTSGSPDIRDDIRRRSLNGALCALIDDPRAELTALLAAPFWRLLDPTPLTAGERNVVERWMALNRVRRVIPDGRRSTWHARRIALQSIEPYGVGGPNSDMGGAFAAISEALWELHMARDTASYARYAVALDAVLELWLSENSSG